MTTTRPASPTAAMASANGPVLGSGVYPNIGAVGGSSTLVGVIGALLTITLMVACVMVIVSAAAWALAAASGNYHAVAKARAGLFVAIAGAALAGGGVAWMNFLLHLGTTL